ncbi:hypothetical protein Xoosp13_348 [Xanthomonas phage Xoo-sp13]|nr:hypothetical protein Xoosp13_348 [Xanthomonas phage Xoo-sp13]
MDITLVLVIVAFAAIVLGVATYKHYKKKARLAALKNDDALSETPKAPSVGGGSSDTTKPPQHAK